MSSTISTTENEFIFGDPTDGTVTTGTRMSLKNAERSIQFIAGNKVVLDIDLETKLEFSPGNQVTWFRIDRTAGIASIGDADQFESAFCFVMNNAPGSENIKIIRNNQQFLLIDPSIVGIYKLGDIDGSANNGTHIIIDDMAKTLSLFRNSAAKQIQPISTADNFADDAAAAVGGILVGELYHNNGAVRIRRT